MTDPIALRRQVRVLLAAAHADQRLSEPFLLAALARFFPEPVRVPELLAALAWNQERGYADARWNADEERTEWLITPRGRAKEGVR
jgi:hypothetical protein